MYAELLSKIVDEPVDMIAGLYNKGRWIIEPNYQFKKFKFNIDIALSVHNICEFLMGGKPYPKTKVSIKTEFKIGGNDEPKELQEL